MATLAGMANLTQPTEASVDAFLEAVPDPVRRSDAREVVAMMRRVTGVDPVMWGTSMIGFGQHRYEYASGHAGEWFVVGLSPRKAALTLYGIHDGYREPDPLLADLGSFTLGKGCIYLRKLSGVDRDVLEVLVGKAWERRA